MSINLSPLSDDLNVSPQTPEICRSPARPSPMFPSDYSPSPELLNRVSPQQNISDTGNSPVFLSAISPDRNSPQVEESSAAHAGEGARSSSVNTPPEEILARKYSQKGFQAYDRAVFLASQRVYEAAIDRFSAARKALSRAQSNFVLASNSKNEWLCSFNLVRIRHRVAQIYHSMQEQGMAKTLFTSAKESYEEHLKTAPNPDFRSYCEFQLRQLIAQNPDLSTRP